MLTEYYWISSASLHPPTSVTRSAGFANVFAWLVPGVPLRSTPGFTLSPAPRVLQMFLHGWSWGSAALHPRLYAVTRSAGFANVFAGWSWGSTALHPRLYAVAALRGLCKSFCMAVPGVPLRSTPGFTLSPAPRV